MGSLLCTLTVIRRLYTLGTFLKSRFTSLGLLFALCRKLIIKLTTCRLWYCRGPVVTQKPKSAQSCTQEHPDGPLNLRGPAVASSVPASSSRSGHRTMSRALFRSLTPNVGRSTPTPPISDEGYSLSVLPSTSQNSGTITPEPPEGMPLLGHYQIDVTSGISSGSLQEGTLHLTPSHTPYQIAFPMNPGDTSRYQRHIMISRDRILGVIEPLTMTFPHSSQPGVPNQGSLNGSLGSWTPATHPEGALYFYDEKRRLFTDTDMRDEALRSEAEQFYDHLTGNSKAEELANLPGEYDLVLEIKTDQPQGSRWFYYYVCHGNRCLFWLEKYPVTKMTDRVGVQSLAHIKHQLEYHYWSHWSLFPVNFSQRRLSKEVYDELLGMLVHGCIDVMTSRTSTLWLDDDQMQKMIKLIQDAKMASAGEAYYTAGATRLLSLFANWRFEDLHGQINARLKRNEAIYKIKRRKSILITVLSPLLFFAPQRYLAELEEAWVDEHILEPVWKSLMTKMLGEWSDLILWSTVMLSVNVGFLAVPGVLPSGPNNSATTPATPSASPNQISNYLSLVASVGSIVVGLLLVRHHRTKKEEDPDGAAQYLFQNDHKYIGLEPMAIVFSLPWALLMWAMMLFSIELLISCFRYTDLQLRVPIGIVSTFVAVPIAWCIWNSWKAKFDGTDM
ncbi:hypothetical protein EDB92DRAFT_1885927 [Lactarius akahatsu]|uniref:Uncharacterized protein n=1 Tax=Lactarius akahatsu TaxID=416441 RepID=A0AAD4L8L0_9AGAM|nr:hypothetical protein EDB92DRAFT_1885927 [Lactarius akahatsu]